MKIILFILIILFFNACATKIEYRDVYIPQRCDVEIPKLNSANNVNDRARESVIYTKKLEKALTCCVKGICE